MKKILFFVPLFFCLSCQKEDLKEIATRSRETPETEEPSYFNPPTLIIDSTVVIIEDTIGISF